jgi:hypothetical protein
MCYWKAIAKALGGNADPSILKDRYAVGADRIRHAKTHSYQSNRNIAQGIGMSIIMVGRNVNNTADFYKIFDFAKADSWIATNVNHNRHFTLVITNAGDHFTAVKGSELTDRVWARLVNVCDDWERAVQVPRVRVDTSLDYAIAQSLAEQQVQVPRVRVDTSLDYAIAQSLAEQQVQVPRVRVDTSLDQAIAISLQYN